MTHSLRPAGTSAASASPSCLVLRVALAAALASGLAGTARAASDVTAPAGSAAMPAALGEPVVREAPRHDAFVDCESAVSSSLRQIRGSAVQGVRFAGDARDANSDGDHVDVKGSGHYRRGSGAPIEFHYSCAFDRASGTTSGVVLHETEPHPAAAALPVWQADLSRLSPESCESAVASRLQAAHARASGIVFDGGSRKLEPAAEGRTALAGSGRLVRAPGMQPGAFRYRCEFDANGRLASSSAND